LRKVEKKKQKSKKKKNKKKRKKERKKERKCNAEESINIEKNYIGFIRIPRPRCTMIYVKSGPARPQPSLPKRFIYIIIHRFGRSTNCKNGKKGGGKSTGYGRGENRRK
jgi:hypothetical protein